MRAGGAGTLRWALATATASVRAGLDWTDPATALRGQIGPWLGRVWRRTRLRWRPT
jgi:hypothetical protein